MKKLFALPILLLALLPFHAQAAPQYALAVSSQANRGAPSFLGSTSVLTGNVYVFTSLASAINANPTGIKSVCYWLDRAATGTSDHCGGGKTHRQTKKKFFFVLVGGLVVAGGCG